jgi:sulfur relay (sulfurtransferase) complex TusBCD TusD component (DsrE family)
MREREELEAWLESLTDRQVQAYACQNGIEAWGTVPVNMLRKELCSQLLIEITEGVE